MDKLPLDPFPSTLDPTNKITLGLLTGKGTKCSLPLGKMPVKCPNSSEPKAPPKPGTTCPPLTRSSYQTAIVLPRNLTITVIHPLTMAQVEDLAHEQLLRLWEVLIEMRDEPQQSSFIDWDKMNDEYGFDKEGWVEKVLMSVTVVEGVLRGKWNEPIEEGESVVGFEASRCFQKGKNWKK